MVSPALTLEELLAWNDETATGWYRFFTENPAALDLPCDIYNTKSVKELVKHIVAAELRYAERVAGESITLYEQIPDRTAEELFAVHQQAVEKCRALLADGSVDWAGKLEFDTKTAGKFAASRRKILLHALLHSIRHYAQLATLVRQHGYNPGWMMDFLATNAME
ncbi:MAG: DinB family protein [Acidobacteriaceae bacterium]